MHPVAIICYGFICHYVQRIVFFVISLLGWYNQKIKIIAIHKKGIFPFKEKGSYRLSKNIWKSSNENSFLATQLIFLNVLKYENVTSKAWLMNLGIITTNRKRARLRHMCILFWNTLFNLCCKKHGKQAKSDHAVPPDA